MVACMILSLCRGAWVASRVATPQSPGAAAGRTRVQDHACAGQRGVVVPVVIIRFPLGTAEAVEVPATCQCAVPLAEEQSSPLGFTLMAYGSLSLSL